MSPEKEIPQYRAPPKKEICQLADMQPTFFKNIDYSAHNGSYLPQLPSVQCDIWHANNQFQLIPLNCNLNLVSAYII